MTAPRKSISVCCCKMRRVWPVFMLALVLLVSTEFFLGGLSLLAKTKVDVNVELQVGYSDIKSLIALAPGHNGNRSTSGKVQQPERTDGHPAGTGDGFPRTRIRSGAASNKTAQPTSAAVSSRHSRNTSKVPHGNWIVVDFSSDDCPSYQTFPPEWKVLVVGRNTPPSGCVAPLCTVFNPAPPVSRKKHSALEKAAWQLNKAYLWAITQGADQLLDTDCLAASSDALQILSLDSTAATGLLYNATRHFNPYEHFGAWGAVSRARSESQNFTSSWNSRHYVLRDFTNVLVKHGLSDTAHDMVQRDHFVAADGGVRLHDPSDMRFDSSAPPVFIGHETYSSAVSHFTMYHQRAFWGLLLPCRTLSLRCRVIRQVMTQRMLRELDAFAGFYRVTATLRPRRVRLPGMLGTHLHKLEEDVHRWMCRKQATFSECFADLAKVLCTLDDLDCGDLQIVATWLSDLKAAGLTEPDRVSRAWRGVRKTGEVTVALGSLKFILGSGRPATKLFLQSELVQPLQDACKGRDSAQHLPPVSQWTSPVYDDVVLVVVFNYNKFLLENLPYLEATHRPYFKHIVYCIPNVTEMIEEQTLHHVILIEGLSVAWYLMYECLTNAARINLQGVRGYLQIGDDTLLNTWSLRDLPLDSLWIPQGTSTERVANAEHHWKWYWWSKPHGRPGVVHALAELEALSGLLTQEKDVVCPSFSNGLSSSHTNASAAWRLTRKGQLTFSELLHRGNVSKSPELPGSGSWARPSTEDATRFVCNYYGANRMAGKVVHRAVDLFYVPQILRDYFVALARHFMRHQVLIELAVPVIASGLDVKGGQVLHVGVSSLWSAARDRPQNFYDAKNVFLHPFKMHAQLSQQDGKDFFCDAYLVDLFRKDWRKRRPD